MVQYKGALVITGATKGTSRDILYQELGLKSLADRRWSCELFFFHKIIQEFLPSYLQTYHNAISEGAYLTHSQHNKIGSIPARTKVFESSFSPYCIKEWSKLNDKIRNIESINKFNVTILSFIRPKGNSVFDIHDASGIKLLLSRLRLNFSHLNEHKFRHNFNDTVDPMCTCCL